MHRHPHPGRARPAPLFALVLLAACSQERAPRSHVQPNAILKSDLAGQWWSRSTITEVPPSTRGIGFVGAQGEVERVWWEVTERTLIARRTYAAWNDTYDGPDGPDPREGDVGFPGAVVAAYAIEKHFDILRDYNAATGEESNVIIESTERPWYQRAFVRVDWSKNLSENPGSALMFFDDLDVQAESYWQSDPQHEDGLRFERRAKIGADHRPVDEDGDGVVDQELGYFDLTNHYVIAPPRTDPFGIGVSYPACWWNYQLETGDCASQPVKVRHSFWKIPGDHEYQPMEYDQRRMAMFGVFERTRRTYDRDYMWTQSPTKYLVNRFNLFSRWFAADGGLLPIGERLGYLRKLAYFVSDEQPEELFVSSQTTIDHWDFALRRVVASMKLVGQSGGRPVSEREIHAAADALLVHGAPARPDDPGRVLYACHNPVRPDDPEACWVSPEDETVPGDAAAPRRAELESGPACTVEQVAAGGCRVRNGDLRYSILWWVHEPNASGPGGYGPPSADPLTGETLSANAYLYGAALERNARWVTDIVRILNGELTVQDLIQGANVRVAARALRGEDRRTGAATHDDDEVRRMVQSMRRDFGRGLQPGLRADPYRTAEFRAIWRERLRRVLDAGVLGDGTNLAPERINRLRGTPIEDRMMSEPEQLNLAGLRGDSEAVNALAGMDRLRASPLTRLQLHRHVREIARKLEARGIDQAIFDDSAYLAQALRYAEEGLTTEQIRARALHEIYLAYGDHELGHNMGLRHNFEGSFDSVNYFPQYWELRRADGTMGPRHKDPMTEAERAGADLDGDGARDGSTYEYAYSSVMDYTGRYYGDIHGLGRWDHAAVNLAWGGMVEAFDTTRLDYHCGKTALVQSYAEWGSPSPFYYDTERTPAGWHSLHYTEFPLILADDGNAAVVDGVVVGEPNVAALQERVIGVWSEEAAQLGVPAEATMSRRCYDYSPSADRCGFGRPDYTWREFDPTCDYRRRCEFEGQPNCCDAGAPGARCCEYQPDQGDICDAGIELDAFELGDGTSLPRVPYRFCSDEFAGGSITCQRFDWGADVLENTRFTIDTYKNYYVFNNFRRDRYGWPNNGGYVYDYFVYDRYFDPMATVIKYYVLYRTLLEDIVSDGGQDWFDDVDEFFAKDWGFFTVAAVDTFRAFGEIITMPEPGTFTDSYGALPDGTAIWQPCNDVDDGYCPGRGTGNPVVDVIDGRYLSSTWDFSGDECRYSWYLCQERIGHMIDKKLALQVLADGTSYFLARDTSVDARFYAINYYKAFKPQLLELFGALLADDYEGYAPRFVAAGPVAGTGDPPAPRQVAKVDWLYPEEAARGELIDPATGFQVQLHAAVWGMALFPTIFDQSFVDHARVYVEGGGDDYVNVCRGEDGAFDEARCVRFAEPLRGKTYVARRSDPEVLPMTDPATGEVIDREFRADVGARVIERLEELHRYWQDRPNDPGRRRLYERFIDNVDLMRALAQRFDTVDYASGQ